MYAKIFDFTVTDILQLDDPKLILLAVLINYAVNIRGHIFRTSAVRGGRVCQTFADGEEGGLRGS